MDSPILIGLNINKVKTHEYKTIISNRLVDIADEHLGTKENMF